MTSMPWAPEGEEYLGFQKTGIDEIGLRPQVLLADEMGLGKTIQIIGYMNVARPARVLVVCPNNLRLNWISEIEKWMDPALRATYDIEQCTTSLFVPTNFTVASYEGLTRWAPVLKEHAWDLFIMDEAHYIKNSATKRGRAALEFIGVKKKILATGTPICNYPYELFPLIHFLDPEQWPSRSTYERRYCPYANKYGYHLDELQKFLREGAPKRVVKNVTHVRAVKTAHHGVNTYECVACGAFDGELAAMEHVASTKHEVHIQRSVTEQIVPVEEIVSNEVVVEQGCGLMIRRLKKEVLPELPRKRRQIIELPAEGELLRLVEEENRLWHEQADLFKALEEALGTWKESTNDDEFDRMIEALKFNKQYFFEEIARIRHALAVAKVPYVIEHIEDVLETKDKLVCFIHHHDVGKALQRHFADKSVLVYGPMNMGDRDEAIKRFWNDDKCELFIGSLKVAGLGINLQNAANVVFAELDWVPGTITQAEDRCHRIGQDKSLLVQHLVAQNSMDSHMTKKIVAKQKSIQKALNRSPEQEASNG